MYLGLKVRQRTGFEVFACQDEACIAHEFLELESDDLLKAINTLVEPKELEGVVALQGAGTFSSVRTAAVVANTLSSALKIPIVGESGDDEAATRRGIARLKAGENNFPLAPAYDREPNITLNHKAE